MALTKGFHHVMITVRDIDKSREFYTKGCDLKIIAEDKNLLGLSDDTSSLWISTSRDYMPKTLLFDRNQLGLDHLAFTVTTLKNLQEIEKNLKSINAEMEDGGITDDGYGSQAIFAKDPDGMKVEFKLLKK